MAKREDKKPFVTVTEGLLGWFAVLLTWTDDDHEAFKPDGGLYEPFSSGFGYYRTRDDPELLAKAREWAEAEEVEFRP